MNINKISGKVREYFKSGFFKGVGIGAGILTTALLASPGILGTFSATEVLSSSKMNQNFQIAAPANAIMAFYAASCPVGWAPADGTNGTPDLRGVFIRGRNDFGNGVRADGFEDPDGNRAHNDPPQVDRFQGHAHSYSAPTTYSEMESGAGAVARILGSHTTSGAVSDGTHGAPRAGLETRPKNVALTYCMRLDY